MSSSRLCNWQTLPLALAALAALAASGSTAAAAPFAELTPFAGYRVGNDLQTTGQDGTTSADPRDGNGWGLDFGLYRDAESFYELLYSRRDAGLDSATGTGSVDLRIEYLHFGGTLLFPQPRGYAGYLSMTLGMTRFGASAGGYGSDSKLSGSLGGGVRFFMGERLAATVGVRGYLTMVDSDTELVCISAGGAAECLVKSSGRSFFEAEAQAGVTFRF
jgi:hypothetical protein